MPRGVYERTPEHGAAISNGMKNSDAVKAAAKDAAEARRGVSKPPGFGAKISKALTGVPHSSERIAAIKKGMKNSDAVKAAGEARRGVPHSGEWNAAISDGMKNSEAAVAVQKSHRGGNDIVNHHYIYDHSDLSKYTMKMTRSRHTILHNNMRKSGTIVPRINRGV